MRVAHEEGLHTSATMLIGHIETLSERIEHMAAIRDMQDYAWGIDGYSNCLNENSVEMVNRAKLRQPGVFAKSIDNSEFGFVATTTNNPWPLSSDSILVSRNGLCVLGLKAAT